MSSAELEIRDRLKIGTRVQITHADPIFKLPPEKLLPMEVIDHQYHGIMCQQVDGGPEDKQFIPVGCTVGRTVSEIVDDEHFRVGMQGTWITYHWLQEPLYAMVVLEDSLWHVTEEGADFKAMSRRLFDWMYTPGRWCPLILDAAVFSKRYVDAHPREYPLGAPVSYETEV